MLRMAAAVTATQRSSDCLIYTVYVYPFEIAAVILLVAIVAAIALTLRHRKESKYIDPARQIEVKRKDRVRMVAMPSEKKRGSEDAGLAMRTKPAVNYD